jgi:uncharacterized protein (DUF433 family)
MHMTTVSYPHIEIDPQGEPVITGANTKVVVLAMDHLAHHWDATEIHRQRPHLTLGQIYSALAYYYDHEIELNNQIDQLLRRENELLDQLGTSRIRAKLQAKRTS